MASNQSIDDLITELERQINAVEGAQGRSMTVTLGKLKKDILALREQSQEVFVVTRGKDFFASASLKVYSSAEVAERAVYADLSTMGINRDLKSGIGTVSRDADTWQICKHTIKDKTWKEEMGYK